ncbi:MAG: PDZ domain-containing protein [Parachlamydiaceae bacterium]|nr:PDZ domain-containing protein [Parachlamydiaceae bacterium]
MNNLHYFFLCLILLQGTCSGQDSLKLQDIHIIMQQILVQHVDQKKIDSKIIKNALKVYIDKFDPDRIYLLENEVRPFLNLSDAQSEAALEAYKQDRFPLFEQLNSIIQSSILRSRKIRIEFKKDLNLLFAKKSPGEAEIREDDPNFKMKFPRNLNELQTRLKKNILQFINAEKRRFGSAVVMANQPQTLAIYNKNLIENENIYLFLDNKGSSLSKIEQENTFTLLVLKALAAGLDAHTTFYSESEASTLKTQLEQEFQGIGIIFRQNHSGAIFVKDMSEGGPAVTSNLIKINDILIEINGKKIGKDSLKTIIETIRSNKDVNITLTLQHKDEKETFKVTLQKKELAVRGNRVDTSYRSVDDGIIGIVVLHSFYQGTGEVTSENDVRKALSAFKQKGNLKGLILDLRENSGGFLGQAVKVAGLFITNGVVVISKYFNGEEHYYRDLDGKSYYDGPFVILTSRATASAAEIVAQALQDYGVAIVVGDESTYGKGTIQNQNVTGANAKGSSLFKVTVGKYYTVSGKTPQLIGVKADIVVPGLYNYERFGEQYLEFTVPSDTINNEYADDLGDIKPDLRKWYHQQYLPSLQQKSTIWQTMLPTLKADSAIRLGNNREYQKFLELIRSGRPTTFFTKDLSGNPKPVDFQLNEAVNIVKEMIRLQKEEHSRRVVNETKKGVAEKPAFSYD